jgi:Zn-dependent protease
VRVEPVFWVIAFLFGFRYAEIDEALVLIWVGVTFVSILVHELGHGLALKVFGHPSSIVLHGFGGVTLSRRRLDKVRSVVVSVAGSASALVVLWVPAELLKDSDWALDQSLRVQNTLILLAFANLWWSLANLLPIRPLDGGNVAVELFGIDTARKLSIVVAVLGAAYALSNEQQFAGLFALFLAYSNYQELRMARAGQRGSAFDVDGPAPPAA